MKPLPEYLSLIEVSVCCLALFASSFPPRAAADQATNALDQTVRSIALQPDGRVVIGGDFTVVQDAARGHVARLNPDGTTDFTFMNGLAGANGQVYSTGILPDGKLLIGGTFGTVNGATHPGLARLNTNGSLDMSFNAVTGAAPFAIQSDGKILAATAMLTIVGNQDAIFRLNTNGTRDLTWTSSLSGGTVSAMALQADEELIVAGDFVSVNGLIRDSLARLGTNGSPDVTFGNGMSGVNGLALSCALQSDGKTVIGGYFFFVDGVSRTRLARVNPDGSVDPGFQNGMAGANDDVVAIALQTDGKVLIGGYFTSVNNAQIRGIARLNPDGSLDTGFAHGMPGANGPVLALALQADGKVVIGGAFTSVNGVTRYRIARLNADGSVDPSFHNGGPPLPLLSMAGIVSNHFGFQLSGPSNVVAVVESSTNLASWWPLATNRLDGSPLSFIDPASANLSRTRFYRARLQ